MGGIKQSITDDGFRELAKDFGLTLNEDFLNWLNNLIKKS